MFTGIIEALGRITNVDATDGGTTLTIQAPTMVPTLKLGDSIAINGTCLTAVDFTEDSFQADVVLESLAKTNLGDLVVGSPVNLERPMQANGRFDGHIVQGHVDTVGVVTGLDPEGDGETLFDPSDADVARYIVEKGSITVDGVSLTVAALTDDVFQIALIPHTLEVTTLGTRAIGDRVNLEVDVIAKYVERLLGAKT